MSCNWCLTQNANGWLSHNFALFSDKTKCFDVVFKHPKGLSCCFCFCNREYLIISKSIFPPQAFPLAIHVF